MGKVIERKLPEDHPIFKAGWTLGTIRKLSKTSKKSKNDLKYSNN